jgi:hypothetical protein
MEKKKARGLQKTDAGKISIRGRCAFALVYAALQFTSMAAWRSVS